jgi:hypothetical protein
MGYYSTHTVPILTLVHTVHEDPILKQYANTVRLIWVFGGEKMPFIFASLTF